MLIILYLISLIGIFLFAIQFGAALIQILFHLVNIIINFVILVFDLTIQGISFVLFHLTDKSIRFAEQTSVLINDPPSINNFSINDSINNSSINSSINNSSINNSSISKQQRSVNNNDIIFLRDHYFFADEDLFIKYLDNNNEDEKDIIKNQIINSHYFNLNKS